MSHYDLLHTHDHTCEPLHRPDVQEKTLEGKFKFSVLFTFVVLLAEVIGGLLTNSLALLSDAAHVFADLFALALSLFAIRLARLPASGQRTYGNHRTEIIAAATNGLSLLAIGIWILWEGVKRILSPEKVLSFEMLIVAVAGLVANVIIAVILHNEDQKNLNVRSAFLHVIGDAASSVGVIIGGVIMMQTGWYVADPIISIGIAGVLLWGAGRIILEAGHILLEGTPRGVHFAEVVKAISGVPGVRDVHDLHIWSICSHYTSLSTHVLVEEQSVQETHVLLRDIAAILRERFGIFHTTIQIECTQCLDAANGLLCNSTH
ncbi:MAG: cation transporter [Armatimonadetes bacterium]|nr:cation transporter [Armatimonadota bacterium]